VYKILDVKIQLINYLGYTKKSVKKSLKILKKIRDKIKMRDKTQMRDEKRCDGLSGVSFCNLEISTAPITPNDIKN